MNYVRTAAQRMIKKYNTNDPFEIAELLKIKIMYEYLGDHIRGFYQACPKVRIIHINIELDDINRRIVCAHELGHSVFHGKLNTIFLQKHTFCDKNKFEREANTFAAELLVPNGLFFENPDYTLDQIAALHNIPVGLLKIKYKM